jgi:pilus assembly protein CpaD
MCIRVSPAARAAARLGILRPVIGVAALALLSGCGQLHTDSVVVGGIPDDYRTNHPIVISEQERHVDVPVATGDRNMTHDQRVLIQGLLSTYDIAAAQPVSILVPIGAANDASASRLARQFATYAKSQGVPGNRIQVMPYQVDAPNQSAPVRISFSAITAHTDKCGRWPDDLTNNADNKHYANFGCSYQNNLAAQISNPNDLIGPRKWDPMDAEKNGEVIRQYRERGIWPEFLVTSEVDYNLR